MPERVSRVVCENCHRHHQYDPQVGSYYAAPKEGGFLLSYCPECGCMLPLLGVASDKPRDAWETETISGNKKKRLARRLAKIHGLDPRLVLDVSRVLWTVDLKRDYVPMLTGLLSTAFNIELTVEQVRSVLE